MVSPSSTHRGSAPRARAVAHLASRASGALFAGGVLLSCAQHVRPCEDDGFCPRDASEYLPGEMPSPCGDGAPMVPIDPPGLIVRNLGGPHGTGTDCLPPNDDSYSSAIPLRGSFPMQIDYFGQTYGALYVNTNGNVSFRSGIGTYTPSPFPIRGQPMIAPWWGDVDTRGGGSVCWAQRPGLFFATWLDVGFFSANGSRRNTFQLILRARPDLADRAFEAQFRYQRCEWTTGDASGGRGGFGGTPAQAGFDAGDGANFLTIPGSRTMDILRVCQGTNTDRRGIYRFVIVRGRPFVGTGCPEVDGGVGDASRADATFVDALVDGASDAPLARD